MDTLSQAVDRLVAAGYADSFQIERDGLRAVEDGGWYAPDALACDAIERFEGESDPADEVILFALRTHDGRLRGTLVSGFAGGGDPAAAEVIRALPQPPRP